MKQVTRRGFLALLGGLAAAFGLKAKAQAPPCQAFFKDGRLFWRIGEGNCCILLPGREVVRLDIRLEERPKLTLAEVERMMDGLKTAYRNPIQPAFSPIFLDAEPLYTRISSVPRELDFLK